MTAHSIETPSQRASLPRTPLIATAALVAIVAAFAVAYLLAHHSAPKPLAAKVVTVQIKPGPDTATLKKAFATTNIHALIKPVVHKKKPKAATTTTSPAVVPVTPVSPTPSSSSTYTPPATTYVPPAASSGGSSSGTSSAPKKKSPPSGGGVITVG